MPSFSIIIPAFNEARRLPLTLEKTIAALKTSNEPWEIIIVNDGSEDDTRVVLKPHLSNRVRLINLPRNRGKGYTVSRGVRRAKYELCVLMDADNATPITELTKLAPLIDHDHPIVIGSRHVKRSRVLKKQPWHRRLISRLGNWLIQLLLLPGLRDTQCGFKVFSTPVAQQLFQLRTMDRFSFDIEILTIARRLGYGITEAPVVWTNDQRSSFRPLPDTARFFWDLLKIKWNVWRGVYRAPEDAR